MKKLDKMQASGNVTRRVLIVRRDARFVSFEAEDFGKVLHKIARMGADPLYRLKPEDKVFVAALDEPGSSRLAEYTVGELTRMLSSAYKMWSGSTPADDGIRAAIADAVGADV